jgi:intracellular sulfur oxidation DsrE/DsrF family protein
LAFRNAAAHHTDTHWADRSTHQIIYQCNEADPDYLNSILFSIGELVRKYEDEVHVIVACFGKGIHLLAKNPGRPIPEELQQRASSLSAYGVWFHACENTMKSLGWTEDDMVDYARIVPIGVDDIMLWQEKGYAYFRW